MSEKKRDLRGVVCGHCGGRGYRGMDACNTCDTTGSVFRVPPDAFPNTREGYTAACKAAGIDPTYED